MTPRYWLLLLATLGSFLHAGEVLLGPDLVAPMVFGRGNATWEVRTQRLAGHIPVVRSIERPVAGAGRKAGAVRMAGDHVLVRFAKGAERGAMRNAQAVAHGLALKRRVTENLWTVSFPVVDAKTFDQVLATLAATPGVVSCGPDYLVSVAVEPNDPLYPAQWPLRNTGQEGGKPDSDIRASVAWDRTTGSRNVVVGILDSGIDRDHPDLAPNLWVNPGEDGIDAQGSSRRSNGVDDDGNGLIDDWSGWDFVENDNDPQDPHGHGTHCAGVIGAAGGDAQGMTGVNWQVSLVGLRFLDASGSGRLSDAIAALDYAGRIGCHITSNSWGFLGYSVELEEAVRNAGLNGQLFVAAAGNSTANVDQNPFSPAAIALPNVISVMATDRSDFNAWFSNYGRLSVHLAAPGVDILSTKPGGGHQLMSGTSMAAPHVAGACALVKAMDPAIGADGIRARVLAGIRPLPVPLPCTTGGVLDCAAAVRPIPGPAPVITDIRFLRGSQPVNWAGPGDVVTLQVRVVNIGTAATTSLRLSLEEVGLEDRIDIDLAETAASVLAAGELFVSAELAFHVRPGLATPSGVYLRVAVLDDQAELTARELVLPLHQASRISGQVTSTVDGAPLSGVYVYHVDDGVLRTTTSDAEGRYVFADVFEGDSRLTTFGFGWKSRTVDVTTPPDRIVDLALEPAAFFSFDWDIPIEVEQGRTCSDRLTITNSGHAPGSWRLSPEGILAEMGGLWHMAAGPSHDEDGLSLAYIRASTASSATGEANAGTLRFRGWEADGEPWNLTFWERSDVPDGGGACVCEASGDGGTTWTRLWTALPGDGEWRQVTLALPWLRSADLQIRWVAERASASVSESGGWYIDEPTLMNRFDAWLMTPWVRAVPEAASAAPGSSVDVQLLVSAQGLPAGRWNAYPRFADGTYSYFLGLNWTVLPAPSIAWCNTGLDHPGRLQAGGGAVTALAVLANQGSLTASGLIVALQVDDPSIQVSGGVWSIGELAGGVSAAGRPWSLRVDEDYAGPPAVLARLVASDAAGREWMQTIPLDIDIPNSIGGTVLDAATDLPVAGALVTIAGRSTTSREDGRFRLSNLPAGIQAVTVSAAGYLDAGASLASTFDNAEFRLDSRRLTFAPPSISCSLLEGGTVQVELVIAQAGSLPATLLSADWPLVPWLRVPADIASVGRHQLTLDAAGLAPGAYTAHIDFTSNASHGDHVQYPIELTVTAINRQPRLDDQEFSVMSGEEIAINCTGSDPDGDALSYAMVSEPEHGTRTGVLPHLHYRPVDGHVGEDSLRVEVSDGHTAPVTALVRIHVLARNHQPRLDDQEITVLSGDEVAIDCTGSDPDGDTLTYVVIGEPAHGSRAGVLPQARYRSVAGYIGEDSFRVQISDGHTVPVTALIRIQVLARPESSVGTAPPANSAGGGACGGGALILILAIALAQRGRLRARAD